MEIVLNYKNEFSLCTLIESIEFDKNEQIKQNIIKFANFVSLIENMTYSEEPDYEMLKEILEEISKMK